MMFSGEIDPTKLGRVIVVVISVIGLVFVISMLILDVPPVQNRHASATNCLDLESGQSICP